MRVLAILFFGFAFTESYSQSATLDTVEIQSGTVKEIYSVISNTEIKHGVYQMYYNNILLCTGFYYENQKHGPWTKFYPNGQISTQGVYLKDKKNGLWKFIYENKELASITQFDKGEPSGKWIGFYMNGDLVVLCNILKITLTH